MPRVLAFAIEPADAFVGVLRMKAVAEAGRWPPELSRAFRGSIDAEFRRMEDIVRTVGLCYADLEESGVAEVNRSPQSRFDDIDGALHLCACAVSVALDLDHLRMAADHGDRVARDSAVGLASSLRSVLWYLVRTELFVCTRMALGGRDLPPERVLEFVDAYLAAAWREVPISDPPAPEGEREGGTRTGTVEHQEPTPGGRTVDFASNTAVFAPDERDSEPPTRPPPSPDVTAPILSPFAALSEDARFFLFQADIREKDWPVHRATLLAARRTVLRRLHPDTAGPHAEGMYGAAERGAAEVLQLLAAQEAAAGPGEGRSDAGATVQIRASDLLTEEARYFLDQAGMAWPGDAPKLDAARGALAEVAAGDPARTARLERGYEDLCRMLAR